MKIEDHIPTEQLRPYIKAFRIIECEEEIVNRVIPNTSFVMAFRFKGQISYLNNSEKTILPATTFSGLRKTVRLINYARQSSALLVMFTETGVSGFFKQPPLDLFEQSAPLDSLFPFSELSVIEERLNAANNNRNRVAIVEQFLCSKLFYNKTDGLVAEAIANIYSKNGLTRIEALANGLYISLDAFEKRFRKVTGTTPKQFSSIVRLRSIVLRDGSTSFIDLAFESGYYDQSHFNKDFKLFTGQTPTDFRKSASFW